MKTYYLICSNPRSGTNLMRHLMIFHKVGMPIEITPSFESLEREEILKVESDFNLKYLYNFLVGTNLHKHHKNPYFRNKPIQTYSRIVWSFQFHEIIKNLRKVAQVSESIPDKSLLQFLFPNIKYVYLYRNDKIKQAVSLQMSRQSGQWLITNRNKDTINKYTDYQYDLGSLAQELIWRLDGEVLWQDIFNEFRIQPLKICYEDFIKDMAGTIIKISNFLDLSVRNVDNNTVEESLAHPDAPTKQTHPVKQEWESMFRCDAERIIEHLKKESE